MSGDSTHLRAADYRVEAVKMPEGVGRFSAAAGLVRALHYSGGVSKTATDVHVLLDSSGSMVGVAWWLPPTKVAAVSVAGDNWRRCTALSRLVVAPEVPTNGASFLVGRSIRILRMEGRWDVLLTYADQGEGHDGAIYRATNWEYLGETRAKIRFRSPGGALASPKRGPRTYSRVEMEAMGFVTEGPFRKHKFRKILRSQPDRGGGVESDVA